VTDIDIPVEDFLEHFGVKGMKWGQRKADSSTGNSSNNPRYSNAQKATAAVVGAGVLFAGYKAAKKILKMTGHNKVAMLFPDAMLTDHSNKVTRIYEPGRVALVKVKDIQAAFERGTP